MPLVVSNDAEGIKKTSKAVAALAAIGADADTTKARESVNLRRGKGKMRNRRYVGRKGPLVVYAGDEGISRSFRNLPGVELASVERLNLLQVCLPSHHADHGLMAVYWRGDSRPPVRMLQALPSLSPQARTGQTR